MTGGAEVAALAGESQQILMITALAFHPSKSIMQDSTIEILKNDFFYMGSQVSILLAEILIVCSFKLLIIVFYALIVWTILGFSPSVLFCAFT
jgi:hypothetical protein